MGRCGSDLGPMWVPCGAMWGDVGMMWYIWGSNGGMWDICGHDVGPMWVRCGIPRGTHIKPGCKTISDQHEFHTCKPRVSHVGPILVQCVVLAGNTCTDNNKLFPLYRLYSRDLLKTMSDSNINFNATTC